MEQASETKPILCLAFNKKIAEEMAKRFSTTTSVRTFNSLGHRIWSQAIGKQPALDPKKSQNLLKEIIAELKGQDRRDASDNYWEIINAVAMAKAVGYVPEGKYPGARRLVDRAGWLDVLEERPTPSVASLADELLHHSIRTAYAGNIDYNDQIYMSALFGGTYPRFPLVFVDEAQDLSPVNHAMLERLCKASRLVIVGDPWQSIYGFRGALRSGMTALASQFSMQSLDLSVSFRCPEAIVRAVSWRVPHMKWSKPGGHFETIERLTASCIDDSSAIICRNNAPLLRMALQLLSIGRPCSMAGSDIGPKLVAILRKFGPTDLSRSSVLTAIRDWQDAKEARGLASAADMADSLRVFANQGRDLGEAIQIAEHIFAAKGRIRLSTGHKAKGLEFPIVYHLDPGLIGSSDQEENLHYVITTRSSDRAYEVNSRNVQFH